MRVTGITVYKKVLLIDLYNNFILYNFNIKFYLSEGEGTMYSSNGNIFFGQFANGNKEGTGKFFYGSTRKIYEGEWLEDKPNYGEFRDPTLDERKTFEQLAKQYVALVNAKDDMTELDQTIRRAGNRQNRSNNAISNIEYRPLALPELTLADPKDVINESKLELRYKRQY